MGSQKIVCEFANRTLLLVYVCRDFRAGRQVGNQALERSLGVWGVMEDLVAGDEIEEPGSKRQPREIGLNQMGIRHRAGVLIREFNALAQVDSEYLRVRVLGIKNRVSAQSRSGIQDEALVSKKLPQALDGLESVVRDRNSECASTSR